MKHNKLYILIYTYTSGRSRNLRSSTVEVMEMVPTRRYILVLFATLA